MEAKQKAREIWMKFFQKEIELTGNGNGENAYQYAKICVDEILSETPMYTGNRNPKWDYWQSVKQEINNL